ncbi:type II toxin-antitoxin system ParD family antitoxin [Kamptonema animale CS-326]|jgi:putative addiction module CopG family antidote|uniref:type II toxin-antitoxin system ParD family antitoxin n=1 Tax=Kamptonema animale TaxID=92934 RepID=UPI0023302619|nr:type II toxin-antitoxin system ParD family antitoxin [Kamptonema animale]MDB9514363.1 type II toxin-antitoxin system ParD family antitoxin [Kamptonema animale CS-326]
MNISLTPELDQFIQSTVKNGRYSSASEVILAALRLLKERENLVVLNPISSDEKQKPSYDFSALVGRLTWQGDAVRMQRNLRDEW